MNREETVIGFERIPYTGTQVLDVKNPKIIFNSHILLLCGFISAAHVN